MSVWGKILAVLNVLAAAGFVYLAILDYDQRRTWAYAGYRYGLANDGAPVDDKETDLQSVRLVDVLDGSTLKRLQQVGGQPLKTQEEELKRVQGELQKRIDDGQPLALKDADLEKSRLEAAKLQVVKGPDADKLRQLLQNVKAAPAGAPADQPEPAANDPAAALNQKLVKLQKLAYLLEPFAPTFARRDGLTRLMAASLPLADVRLVFDENFENKTLAAMRARQAANKNRTAADVARDEDEFLTAVLDKLQAEFNDEFTQPAQKKEPAEKREAITHALFCASQALVGEDEEAAKASVLQSKAFQRVLVVVGLEAAVHEIDVQTGLLEQMVYEEGLAIERDRLRFALEHERRLRQIGTLKEILVRTENDRKAKERERDEQSLLVQAQRESVNRIRSEVAKAQAETQRLLGEQAKQEDRIIDNQKKLRDATEKNKALERQLRSLEEKLSAKGEAQ